MSSPSAAQRSAGSDGASSRGPTERAASAENEGQAAPSSEPSSAAVEAASDMEAGGAKPGEGDANPPKGVGSIGISLAEELGWFWSSSYEQRFALTAP